MENHVVSVYIPTFNRPALLKRAVESVLKQTYEHVEIIVVNDGDNIPTDLQEYLASNQVVYLSTKGREGACKARNMAIAAASGYFITGLDDDDYFDTDRIQLFLDAVEHHGVQIFFTGYIYAEGDTRKERAVEQSQVELGDILKHNIINNQVFAPKAYFEGVEGFDENLPAWQDFDMWIRMIKTYGAAVYCPNYSYVMDGVGTDRISKNVQSIQKAFNIFMKKHDEYSENEALRACLIFNTQHYFKTPIILHDYYYMFMRMNKVKVARLLIEKVIFKLFNISF